MSSGILWSEKHETATTKVKDSSQQETLELSVDAVHTYGGLVF